ncbi:exo-alpha-sialidase [Bacteroides heparinolyticus]|uniref:sialidase family protein n=1 Tax=Prevotella heparinolytica TaxID=28113 RepID=UPI000D02C05E|nr:sialidase family protein [Bacteroides heparinolyticus]AVM58103.1 exo-alpha-sialidase [Bacteroides heparinolyticus]
MMGKIHASTILFLAVCLFSARGQEKNSPSSIDSVYAPVRVSSVPSDAYIGLSMLKNGEIRHYNYGEQADPGTFYLSSMDKGLTWKKVRYTPDMLFGDVRSPLSEEYIRLFHAGSMGVYCIRTDGGIEGDRTLTKVANTQSIMLKPPVFIRGGKRVVVAAHGDVSPKGCYTYVSDDDGRTWRRSNIVTAPDHRPGGFHKGTRWNHGAVEPTVVELKDGRLWMLMRTAQDRHYEAFSEDGGLTWGESSPSAFYGTITMPTIGRLADGRLLLFWCNTTSLPELATATGIWDDVFTNRDAAHVAISEDDGKTWKGFRELRLNPYRNDRYYASHSTGVDRSVHQSQFIEVAPGKILVATGQHPSLRAMYLFDVNWLYERERSDDFSNGLDDWCVFNYIKGIKGHCAYDRMPGCKLEAHSDKEAGQVLHIKYEADTSLVADSRGAVWNFPAMKQGEFTARIRIPERSEQVSLLLNDRWMNPSDTVARYECMYELKLNRKELCIRDDGWHELSLRWDLSQGDSHARLFVDGKRNRCLIPLKNKTCHGISYVHFIASPAPENPGVYVDWVKACASR